jgi:hypothetical protein
MNRTAFALVVGGALGAGGMTLARHAEEGGTKVTRLSRRDIVERLDGKDSRVTVWEVAIERGGRVLPHRHAGQAPSQPRGKPELGAPVVHDIW